LTPRFVKYKRHAGMNVLVWAETISTRQCRVGVHHFIGFASSAAFPLRIVLIFSFAFFASSYGKVTLCTIFCVAFSRNSFLRFSYFVFHKHSYPSLNLAPIFCQSSSIYKHRMLFLKITKETDSKQEKYPLFTAEGHLVIHWLYFSLLIIHPEQYIRSEPKLTAANFCHLSSWKITFDEPTVHTVRVYWLVKSDNPIWTVLIPSKTPWTDVWTTVQSRDL
jgi:hypothetical protein